MVVFFFVRIVFFVSFVLRKNPLVFFFVFLFCVFVFLVARAFKKYASSWCVNEVKPQTLFR